MGSTTLAHRGGFGDVPAGARALGARKKPIIRLGMGVKVEGQRRDGSSFTRPERTDHFTVRGDQRAVHKFKQIYGDEPKAIKIMVPSSLALALDISYRSFVGGGDDDDGGRPLALGMTNFAPLGYVGGPDVLRVWKQDGSYVEVETQGLDELGKPLDEIAGDLKIEVHATFTFTIPDVLGWGSFAAVTSKGKKSADNLAFALGEMYSAFGAKAPWAFDRADPPLLVLKPDTALTRFEDKDGQARWGKTKIFVLDIVIPEPFEDMRDRLLARQRELAPHGPAAALYGGAVAELEASTTEAGAAAGVVEDADIVVDTFSSTGGTHGDAAPPGEQAGAEPTTFAPAAPFPDEPGPVEADPGLQALADAAALYRPGTQKWPDETVGEIFHHPDGGRDWLRYCLQSARKPALVNAVTDFARVYAPDLLDGAS